MGDIRNGLKVSHEHYGICRRFEKHHLRIRLDGRLDVRYFRSVNKIELDVVIGKNAAEEPKGSAIGIIGNYYVIARFYQFQRSVDRCHAGGKSIPETTAFQRSDILFKGCPRGVLSTGVFKSLVFA